MPAKRTAARQPPHRQQVGSYTPYGTAAPTRMHAIAPRRHSRASPLLQLHPRGLFTISHGVPRTWRPVTRYPSYVDTPRRSGLAREAHRRTSTAPSPASWLLHPLWHVRPRAECVQLRHAGIRGQARSYNLIPPRPVHDFTRPLVRGQKEMNIVQYTGIRW